jgi:hypothetical protein
LPANSPLARNSATKDARRRHNYWSSIGPTKSQCESLFVNAGSVEGTMRVYKGIRGADGTARIIVAEPDKPDRLLPSRTDLFRRCATGLDWGYAGNGPAQCALAVLADALRDDQRAVRVHWEFHCYVIATLPRHLQWQLTQEQVITAAHEIEENAVAG